MRGYIRNIASRLAIIGIPCPCSQCACCCNAYLGTITAVVLIPIPFPEHHSAVMDLENLEKGPCEDDRLLPEGLGDYINQRVD
jgi:hypothetical protein